MDTIIALHGLGSSGEGSRSVRAIKSHFTDYRVITPTYDVRYFPEFLERIKDLDVGDGRLIIVGVSFGGFIARYLANKVFKHAELILLNPSLNPVVTLRKYLGTNKHFITGEIYHITEELLEDLKAYRVEQDGLDIPITVVVAQDDKIIDPNIAIETYQHRAFLTITDGGHRLDGVDYLGIIRKALNTMNC